MREPKLIAAPDKEDAKEDVPRRPWASPADKYFKEQAERLGPIDAADREAVPKISVELALSLKGPQGDAQSMDGAARGLW